MKDPKEWITLTINQKTVTVPKGTKLIDAIEMAGYTIPKMCYHSDLPTSGGICRMCIVADKKKPNVPIFSCKTVAQQGMEIITQSKFINDLRRANAAMLFSYHPPSCLTCSYSGRCEVQNCGNQMQFKDSEFSEILYEPTLQSKSHSQQTPNWYADDNTSNIVKQKNLCINCDRCIQACSYLQGIGVYGFANCEACGHEVAAFGPSGENECIQCGQCIDLCPTGALSEKDDINEVLKCIEDPSKMVVFQTAPAIRESIGEEFGVKPGEKVMKDQLAEGLKMLGDNVYVVDTNFAADLTIIEEGHELIHRLTKVFKEKQQFKSQKESPLPLATSCCPAWILYMEKNYPEYLHKLSTAKSPMQMLGPLIKAYWPKYHKVDPKNIVSVAIMPCTAKKYCCRRPEMEVDGLRNIDYVLTTREAAKMLKMRNIDISQLNGSDYDHPLGISTGAGAIFAVTGGVMEAALRTAYEVITGKEVPFKNLDITPVRGMEGIREAAIPIVDTKPEYSFLKGVTLKVAVAHTLANAQKIMEKLKECDEKNEPYPWHFFEVMACPGGCIGGGGQPKPTNALTRQLRAKLVYEEDRSLPYRKSHDNPEIKKLYEEFLQYPNSKIAHHYLHTKYFDKRVDYSKYVDMKDKDEMEAFIQHEKFPPNRKDCLLDILISFNDYFGYLSDCAIVTIAKHVGVKPIFVLSVASSYSYLRLKPVGDTVIYLCKCQNCVLHGADQLQDKLEKFFQIKLGETTKDNQITLRKTTWLGWCVMAPPALMIKKKQNKFVIPVLDALNMHPNDIIQMKLVEKIPNNVIYYPYTRKGKELPSFFRSIDTNYAIQKACQMAPDDVIKEVKLSGIQGRGGGGFPAWIKWDSVRKEKNNKKYVVANIEEGLPCCFKDYLLLIDPKTRSNMIGGMLICAKVVGANNAIIALRYEYRNLKDDIEQTVKDIQNANPQLKNINVEIHLGAGSYVTGEETALFETIQGNGCRPRSDKSKFPTQDGVYNAPTVIQNAETFAAIPMIVLEGGAKWGDITGKSGEKGVKIFTVCGDIPKPVMIEFPVGTPLIELIEELKLKDIVAAECGGAVMPLVLRDDFNKFLGYKPDKQFVHALGSIVVYNYTRKLSEIYMKKLEFMDQESCKQCVPCRDGCRIISLAYKNHLEGKKNLYENERAYMKIAEAAELTSICNHGKALGPLFREAIKFLRR